MRPAGFRLQHQQISPQYEQGTGKQAYIAWFYLYAGDADRPLRAISVKYGEDLLDEAIAPGRIRVAYRARPGDTFAQDFERALLRHAVGLLEGLIRAGIIPDLEETSESLLVEAEESEARSIAGLLREKGCDYQVVEGRDLFCSAAAEGDDARVGVEGLRVIGRTSRPVCRKCELPDTDYLCSHLMHPQVFGVIAGGKLARRQLSSAECDLGRAEIDKASECRAGGHACWERIVEPDPPSTALLPARALHEELDHLDVVWRLEFGRGLLQLTRAGRVAELAEEAITGAEFDSRLSALGDVLKSLAIADDLIEGEVIPAAHTLARMAAVLRGRLEPPAFSRVESAIGELQATARIRAGAQHAGAAGGAAAASAKLGLPWPTRDWGQAWASVRSRVAEALSVIREEIRALSG